MPALAIECFKNNLYTWALKEENGGLQFGSSYIYLKGPHIIVRVVTGVVTCEVRIWAVPADFSVSNEGSGMSCVRGNPDLSIEVCISLDKVNQAVFHTHILGSASDWVQHDTSELAMEACVLLKMSSLERRHVLGQFDSPMHTLHAFIQEDWSDVTDEENKGIWIDGNSIRMNFKFKVENIQHHIRFLWKEEKSDQHPFNFKFSGSVLTRLLEGAVETMGDVKVFKATTVTDITSALAFYRENSELFPSVKRRRLQNNGDSEN